MTKKVARLAVATLIASIVLMTSVFAQPQALKLSPKGMKLKKLPQGMTQQQLQQRIAPALARLKADAQNQFQQSQREAKAIFDATANERAAVNAALAKNPRYKTFIEQAKNISSGAGTSEAKAQQLRGLAKANQAIFNDALLAAKINHSAFQAKLLAVVPGITLTPDFTVRKGVLKRIPTLKSFSPTPTTKEIVLRPPITFEEFEADNQGIAYSDAVANPNADDGKATSRVTVIGVAGSGTAEAIFGEFVTVPTGVKRVEFTITAKTSYNGSALGVVGAGLVNADIDIFVANEAAAQSGREGLHDSVIAPIAWYAEMEGGRNSDFKFSFDVAAKRGDYLVTGHSRIFAAGGGVGGYASGYARRKSTRSPSSIFMNNTFDKKIMLGARTCGQHATRIVACPCMQIEPSVRHQS